MSDAPDDRADDDDLHVRSLRAVWLALPDEEPPTRGLDALLAAATAKAKEMTAPPASESFWHKLFATLRRPPVLALATVVILLGGAVLISQRDSIKDDAQPKAEPQRDKNVAPAPVVPMEQRAPAADPATPPPAGPMQGHGEADLKAVDETPPDDHTVRKVPVVTKPDVPRHMTTKPTAIGGGKGGELKTPSNNRPGFAEPDKHEGHAGDGVAEEALDDTGKDVSAKTPQESETTRGPRRVMVDDLLTQSRTAATRGDCEESRLIAQRIAKQDIVFYRSRVETDAAIKKCIAANATTLDAQ